MENKLNIQEGQAIETARQDFLALPNETAILMIKNLSLQMQSELVKIAAHQDKTVNKMLAMYQQQLDIANAMSMDTTLSPEERARYFDLSMQIIGFVKETKDKDDVRKSKEKKEKIIFGFVVPIGATGLSIAISVIAKAISNAKKQ